MLGLLCLETKILTMRTSLFLIFILTIIVLVSATQNENEDSKSKNPDQIDLDRRKSDTEYADIQKRFREALELTEQAEMDGVRQSVDIALNLYKFIKENSGKLSPQSDEKSKIVLSSSEEERPDYSKFNHESDLGVKTDDDDFAQVQTESNKEDRIDRKIMDDESINQRYNQLLQGQAVARELLEMLKEQRKNPDSHRLNRFMKNLDPFKVDLRKPMPKMEPDQLNEILKSLTKDGRGDKSKANHESRSDTSNQDSETQDKKRKPLLDMVDVPFEDYMADAGSEPRLDKLLKKAFQNYQEMENTKAKLLQDLEGGSSTANIKKPNEELNSVDFDHLLAKEEELLRGDLSEEEKLGQENYEKAKSLLSERKPDYAAAFNLLEVASTLGNVNAKLHIAWCKLFGTHLQQNIPDAVASFTELADQNVPDAQLAIGFLHSSGIGVKADQGKALVYYTFAAISGSTWARMALGYRFFSGATVQNSCEKALDFYRLVANEVAKDVSLSGGPMVQRIRLLEEAENSGYNTGIIENDLVEYYQLLAEKGDVKAQVGLGQLHYQGGRGVPLDVQKALQYFIPAADAGNPIAMAFLGKIYLEGYGSAIKQDNQTAYKYFKKAADLNNPVGQAGLGLMYLEGRGVEKDYGKAHRYFSQAADQGWVDGQLQLGVMYFNGLGTRRDYKLANKYFSHASQSGHVLAFYNLAQMHATGTGVMRSCSTAVELYKNVAERGKWGEKLMIAHTLYREGYINEAYVIYAFMAELGYEVAQSNAAFLLDKQEVTLWEDEKNIYVRALMYWGRAAGQGYSAALVKLGDYYYYGLGTSVDYEVAAMHYRLASDQQHNAQAMFNLGYMHEQGLGMTKDIYLAKRCYDTAAETSTDAKIPVALALAKLSILFSLKYFEDFKWLNWVFVFDLHNVFGPYWDIYLGTFLIGLLGIIFYYRRFLPH